jgi:electron transfer flavoprotein alpha/beta subunit
MMSSELLVAVCVRPLESGGLGSALGEFDLRAIEYGVRLVRRLGVGARLVAVSAGGDGAVAALQECAARGASDIIHMAVEEVQEDGFRTAQLLAPVLRNLEPDLVICGERSDVGMHGTVARRLAHLIGYPYLGTAVELSLENAGGIVTARVVQRLERGDQWAWGCDLPLVCGVDKEICAPRYLSVRRHARGRQKSPRPVDPGPVETPSQLGRLVVESRTAPRIRPKKSKVASAAMSAADRMRMLRGGKAPTTTGATPDEDPGPRQVSGDAQAAATAIIRLLERRELLEG